MQDGEIQRELLKETRTAKKAIEVSMKIEMGIQNQLKITGTSSPNYERDYECISEQHTRILE